MTGSYAKNTSGGVLRKQVGDISDEIDIAHTGAFTTVNGIIQTLNKLRIYGFNYGAPYAYDGTINDGANGNVNVNCGWMIGEPFSTGGFSEGKCRNWGNPIAEIMYETERYFAGKGEATTDYNYVVGSTNDDDSRLGLPKATWNDPYKIDNPGKGFDRCSKPFMLVLSDINPSYDTDQLPGVDSNFATTPAFTGNKPMTSFDAKALANTISDNESLVGGEIKYIGQSVGTAVDGVCSEKSILANYGLGSLRGLCPEEPTKRGGYYSAAVAYHAHITDLNAAPGDQKLATYAVGLASPLPRIEFKVGPNKKLITLVPFGKTVASTSHSAEYTYKPTNTIVDFFVEYLTPTMGKFRINYEDVEQGADHDMDAIVSYEYQLIDKDGNAVSDPTLADRVKISLSSIAAAGSYIQHLGYIISGTTKDRRISRGQRCGHPNGCCRTLAHHWIHYPMVLPLVPSSK